MDKLEILKQKIWETELKILQLEKRVAEIDEELKKLNYARR
jgi:hypothetical protein